MPYTSPATVVTGTTITTAWGNSVKAATDFLANPPACRARRTTNQSLTTAVAAAIAFDAERYDTDSMHSTSVNTSRITIVTPGLYLLTGHVSFASNATGVREVYLYLNNTTRLVDVVTTPVTGDSTRVTATTVYKLAAADYVEMFAYQTSGGALNVEAIGNHSPELSATWVGTG